MSDMKGKSRFRNTGSVLLVHVITNDVQRLWLLFAIAHLCPLQFKLIKIACKVRLPI